MHAGDKLSGISTWTLVNHACMRTLSCAFV